MARRLFHLRRTSAPPPPEATRCDLVLISHLHHDHLHMPSVRRFDDDIPIVVPRGAPAVVKSLRRLVTIEAEPGDRIHVAGVDIEVLPARHDGARLKTSGTVNTRAMGFRLTSGGRSCWYPGDTGPMDFSAIDPVDLALVPIGGWGPSLGTHHVDPAQAVDAVAEVGARWVLPVPLRHLLAPGAAHGHSIAYPLVQLSGDPLPRGSRHRSARLRDHHPGVR